MHNVGGRANPHEAAYDSDEEAKPLDLPTIDRASLRGTTLRYRDPVMQLLTDLDFASVVSKDAKIGDAVRFTGDGMLRQTPFTLTGDGPE